MMSHPMKALSITLSVVVSGACSPALGQPLESQIPPGQEMVQVMEVAMQALIDSEHVQVYDRPVVADTFAFGSYRTKRQWRKAGGRQWMREIATRLSLPAGGGADPGGSVLISMLPPPSLDADTVRVPARGSTRTRDIETSRLMDETALNFWDVLVVRGEAGEWRAVGIVPTAITGRITIEDRQRWAEGLPPLHRRRDRP